MKKFLSLVGLMLLTLCINASAWAQNTSAGRGPDPSIVRDPVLELDSKKNLEVARHYFKVKKAYLASLARVEEIIAGNPNYSRIDEALYIAGVSNLRLAEKQGSQTPKLPADKYREEGRTYLTRLAKDFPQSEFRKKAEEELKAAGGVAVAKEK